MIRVAILTTDSREHYRDYNNLIPYFGTSPEALLQGFAMLPDVEVHVVSCLRKRIPSPEKLGPNIWFHGLYVPNIGWMRTGFQGCVRAVKKKLREVQPNIVHGQGTERDCAISAVFSGFPNVLTIHGNMIEIASATQSRVGSYNWLASRLENFVLKRTAGVLCNSEHTEALVRPRTRTTWRVPNPVRLQFFEKRSASRISPSKCVLLNVGTVCAYKRQLELLRLAGKLHEQGLNAEFHFIGQVSQGNTYGATFLKEMAEAEKAGFARYIGFFSQKELIERYDQSHALVHVATAEAFGLVVAEALSRELKLFASRVGGVPDIAQGVEGAELFDPNDWDGLGKRITAWVQCGFPQPQKASKIIAQKYHPMAIAQQHVAIYQEVLHKPS